MEFPAFVRCSLLFAPDTRVIDHMLRERSSIKYQSSHISDHITSHGCVFANQFSPVHQPLHPSDECLREEEVVRRRRAWVEELWMLWEGGVVKKILALVLVRGVRCPLAPPRIVGERALSGGGACNAVAESASRVETENKTNVIYHRSSTEKFIENALQLQARSLSIRLYSSDSSSARSRNRHHTCCSRCTSSFTRVS